MTYEELANALFLAALLSPIQTRNSTLDLWNNVKIPLLESYESESISDNEGWYNTAKGQPTYSSLIGVPVSGYRQGPNATSVFRMESSYFHLDCPYQEPGHTLGQGSNFTGPAAAFYLNYNASCGTLGRELSQNASTECDLPSGAYLDDLDSGYHVRNLSNTFPRNFTYWNWGTEYSTFCTLTNTSVEAEVECASNAPCRATRVRRSRLNLHGAAYTVLDEPGGMGFAMENGSWGWLLEAFLWVTGQASIRGFGAAPQLYVADPENYIRTGAANQPSPELFAIRQSQLMNAMFTCITNFESISANNENVTAFGERATIASTTGTTTRTFEVLICHQIWMTILAIASSLLILACLIHPIIRLLLSKCPELMFQHLQLGD
jgi:hypothetical protein